MRCLITGSPRAGTSFVAGLVSRMGLRFGGPLKPGDANNPHGYYEHLELMAIGNSILAQYGGDFMDMPAMPNGWTAAAREQKALIHATVETQGVEAYKGNRLLVLAPLYYEMFPDAAWLLITRNVEETYASRQRFVTASGGDLLTFDEWEALTAERMARWYASGPSRHALEVDYSDFHRDFDETLGRIAEHLELELSGEHVAACREFWRPR